MMMFPKPEKRKKDKSKRQDKTYLEWVSTLPCACCLSVNNTVVPHHLLRNVVRGMGMKAKDSEVIPLCHKHHSELHLDGNETEYLARWNIFDAPGLASNIYFHYKIGDKLMASDFITRRMK